MRLAAANAIEARKSTTILKQDLDIGKVKVASNPTQTLPMLT